MRETVKSTTMLYYLQSMLDYYREHEEKFNDDHSHAFIAKMCACKDMVETLIQEPVNLQLDGKVTVGFDCREDWK